MNDRGIAIVKERLASGASLIEKYIAETETIRARGVPPKLFEAMEYSLRAGGKRLRPILCLETAAKCGVAEKSAMPMAIGLEMLHTATLIHDDLPCMDDDEMRRGKASNHALFGEALALLAGDALFVQALEFPMARLRDIPAQNVLNAMRAFAAAIGPAGVCGGQALDMFGCEGDDAAAVSRIAELKTGALIKAAVLTGASLGCTDERILAKYGEYAEHLGSAFQIVDDILDSTATAEELGKTPGKDAEQGKLTHVSVYGVERAREMAARESAAAKDALAGLFAEDDFLMLLPEYLACRSH